LSGTVFLLIILILPRAYCAGGTWLKTDGASLAEPIEQTADRAFNSGRIVAFDMVEQTAPDEGVEIGGAYLHLIDPKAPLPPFSETGHADRAGTVAETRLCRDACLPGVVCVLLL
jgi:hypothetical protein